ncbi:ATP synthase subunit I [Idiomarina seosinensis]|uniref:ATP synthase subunit I n=1 Tax=Idiomarina seosinensis TaxID=281739 RepID=UPI00384FD9DE
MSEPMTRAGRQLAFKIIAGQLMVLALLTIIVTLSFTGSAAAAVLLGGLSAIVPNALFALIAFLHSGARANQKVVKSFFIGEGVKLLLTAVFISALFVLTNLSPLWLLGGFVGAVFAQWIAPILFLKST